MASCICTLLGILYGFMYMYTIRGIIMASCICTLLGGL